jgi:hypothetical protein
MAYCEFRVSQDEAADNFVKNISSPGRWPTGGIVSGSGLKSNKVCQIFLEQEDPAPFCVDENLTTETCPYAQECKAGQNPR